MSESLSLDRSNSWDNPDHINHIVGFVKRQLSGHAYDLPGQLQPSGYPVVMRFSDRLRDKYLRRGSIALFDILHEQGDDVFAQAEAEKPIELNTGAGLSAVAGAMCLVARAAETEVAFIYDGQMATVAPTSMPEIVEAEHVRAAKAIRTRPSRSS